MAYEFYLGLDTSSAGDAVTVALVEKEAPDSDGEDVTYSVRRLDQLRGEKVVEKAAVAVQNMITDEPYVGRTTLVVNQAGAGLDVLTQLGEQGLSPVAVNVTGGDVAAQGGGGLSLGDNGSADGINVPALELATALYDVYRAGVLKMGQDSEAVSGLAQGIQQYEAWTADTGDAEASEADAHRQEAARNPYVVSTALACWLGEQHDFDPTQHLSGEMPTTGRAKRKQRPDTEA